MLKLNALHMVHTFTVGIVAGTILMSVSSGYWFGLVWFGGFYGISTLVGYLTPNPFLSK